MPGVTSVSVYSQRVLSFHDATVFGVDSLAVDRRISYPWAVSPLRVLPEIAAAATGLTIMMDGGIRRGSDVLKALALGADFVFVGRPFLYAAAIGGEAGVLHAIDLLSQEVNRNMGLLGINAIAEVRDGLLCATTPAPVGRAGQSGSAPPDP